MLSFESDYTQGAHEKVLKHLIETNMEPLSGYGNDPYTQSAKEKILAACNCPNGEVHLLTGGTQTNSIIIDTMLQPFEGVICASSGHINVHEAGAVEFLGHKVLELPAHDGCLDSKELAAYLRNFYDDANHEHMVFPGMVYISHPTEYGTLYTKDEFEAISDICHQYQIPLFLDGARLGYGLMANSTDVTLPFLAKCCDVFYIGGTKVGALCGEAVVFTHKNVPKHFVTQIKQHGALLAKGRLLGVQFDALFTDDLYFEISRHAIEMAMLLKKGFTERNFPFFIDSPTNQQFIILENRMMEKLQRNVRFSFWEKQDDDHTIVRFATSWGTQKEDIDTLFQYIDFL